MPFLHYDSFKPDNMRVNSDTHFSCAGHIKAFFDLLCNDRKKILQDLQSFNDMSFDTDEKYVNRLSITKKGLTEKE